MAKKPGPLEVSIVDERVVTTYPTPGKPSYTAIVSYLYASPVPRPIFIPFSEISKDKEEDLLRQYNDKRGTLYNQYLTARAQRIRDDIEKAAAAKPEIVRLP